MAPRAVFIAVESEKRAMFCYRRIFDANIGAPRQNMP
jgi:hypothetical protein